MGKQGSSRRRVTVDADRIRRAQPRQSAPVRTRRAHVQDRPEPHRVGLAAAHGLTEGRWPTGARALAAAPATTSRSDRRRAPGRNPGPAVGQPATRSGRVMYPPPFRYEAPSSLDQAIQLLHDGAGEAKVLAGGQSLVPLLKLRFAAPDLLVDINNLPGLDYHRVDADGTLRIGALCRHADLERSPLLASRQPTMAAAAPLIADPIVRTRGTLVGSLCHADPQGDWASVATALGGHVVAVGPGGRRSIPVVDFVTGPFQNVLAYDEVAVEAVIPAPKGVPAGGYLKLERRVGDFATAGVAIALETSGSL